MYEKMVAWESMPLGASPEMDGSAHIWRAADKIVFSSTPRTRLERTFDPAFIQR